MRAIAVAALLIGLAGCASSSGDRPAWFADAAAAGAGDYPSLRDVPHGTSANTDATHWAQVENEMVAAGNEVRANPRGQPASQTETPEAFLEEARRDLEETRQSHEP